MSKHASVDPLSVTQFNQQVKSILEGEVGSVRVEGELSRISPQRNGHVYLTLKDAGAKLEGIVWSSVARRLRYHPDVGEKVIVHGSINVYVPHGSYNLIINGIEPAGLGARQAAFEALKAKLTQEGLFAQERKQKLPLLPKTVGVITSPTGAARRDIESVIFRRSPQVKIVLYPAVVQGSASAADLVRGLRMLNRRSDVDVIIIGRGGGSIEDLWSFNEEPVARAIAQSRIPIISAVGHETDTTISDMVADRRAPTPSVAGEIAVPVRDDLLYTLHLLTDRMYRNTMHRLERSRSALENHRLRLENQIDVAGHYSHIQQTRSLLERLIAQHLHRAWKQLRNLERAVRHQAPHERVRRSREQLSALSMRLRVASVTAVDKKRLQLRTLAARLGALSPLSVLERGFSIARIGDVVVRSHAQVNLDDEISILLHEGSITAKVCDKSDDRTLEVTNQEISS